MIENKLPGSRESHGRAHASKKQEQAILTAQRKSEGTEERWPRPR
jgi:hypothetical protein